MRTFTQISENKEHLNYVRNVIFDEENGSYFDFQDVKTEDYDKKIIASNDEIWEVIYTKADTEDGKLVFLAITYDQNSDLIVHSFNTPYDALSFALDMYLGAKKEKLQYYGVKVMKAKANFGERKNSLQEYGRKDYILHADLNTDLNKDEINLVPEYAKDPKVKSLLLSLNTINKFKL